ncbi:hypothetical protein FVER14953_21089 [Fusarium verticillioides]|nr:hypothetical protein FVER14953_21089 [Fusarium verticillioides]
MPPKNPRLGDLLALLELYFAPERWRLQEGRRPRHSLKCKFIFLSSPPLTSRRRRRLEQPFCTSLAPRFSKSAPSILLVPNPSTEVDFDLLSAPAEGS